MPTARLTSAIVRLRRPSEKALITARPRASEVMKLTSPGRPVVCAARGASALFDNRTIAPIIALDGAHAKGDAPFAPRVGRARRGRVINKIVPSLDAAVVGIRDGATVL